MMPVTLVKSHAFGNDFLLVEARMLGVAPPLLSGQGARMLGVGPAVMAGQTANARDLGSFAREVCDRHRGIAAAWLVVE